MAGIDVGYGSRREVNRELALIPFIDFLLCLVAFLLVTAVWSQASRLPANAQTPGKPECCTPPVQPKTLHVKVEDERFVLSWREGSATLSSRSVDRRAIPNASGDVRYPELALALGEEWRAHGVHRHPSDPLRDGVVLHTPNSLEYAHLVGVMDAVRDVKRPTSSPAATEPAFAVSFATN